MIDVQSLTCIYDTKASAWAVELALDGDVASKRFTVSSANDAEMLIEAFEDASASSYDPETGELRFAYEFAEMDEEEDEDERETVSADDGDKDDDEESEDEEDEDQPGSGKKSAA